MNALVKLMNLFALPIMILNLLGGIVSGIWLAILGQWWAIGAGIASLFLSTLLLGIVLMPSALLALPGIYLQEKGVKAGIYAYFGKVPANQG